MEEINISAAIEAILFSSGDSVEKSRIAQALEITEKQVDENVDKLIDDYSAQNRGITIIRLKDSYQMVGIRAADTHGHGLAQEHPAFSGGVGGTGCSRVQPTRYQGVR